MSDDHPDRWLDEYGDFLFRYALTRTGCREIAADLVQDTFVAAVQSASKFDGRSSRSTWLFAILRRRVADHYRSQFRRGESTRKVDPESDSTASISASGGVSSHGKEWPDDPSRLCEEEEFQTTLANCLAKLPETLAEPFILRHVNEKSPKEIREHLGISATNLSMRLHRARIAIRDCLEKNWFQTDSNS